MGFSFKNQGGSKITWGFGNSVECTAFWWGIGGGMETAHAVGHFPRGLLEGADQSCKSATWQRRS